MHARGGAQPGSRVQRVRREVRRQSGGRGVRRRRRQGQPQRGERRAAVGLAVRVVPRRGERAERRRRIAPREERVARAQARQRQRGGRRGRGGGGRVLVGRGQLPARVAPEVLQQLVRAGEALAAVAGVAGDPVADVGNLRGGHQGDQLRVRVRGVGGDGRLGLVVALDAARGAGAARGLAGGGGRGGGREQVAVELAARAVGVAADGHQGVGARRRLHARVAEVGVGGEAALERRLVLGHERAGHERVQARELGRVGQPVGGRRGRRDGRGAARVGGHAHGGRSEAAEGELLGGEAALGRAVGGLGRLQRWTVGRGGAGRGQVAGREPSPGRLPGRGVVARGRALAAGLRGGGPAAGRRGALIAGAALAVAGRPGAGVAAGARVHRGDALLLRARGLVPRHAGLVGLEAAQLGALRRRRRRRGGEAGGRGRGRIAERRWGGLIPAARLRGLGGFAGFVRGREQGRLARRRVDSYLAAGLGEKRQGALLRVQL